MVTYIKKLKAMGVIMQVRRINTYLKKFYTIFIVLSLIGTQFAPSVEAAIKDNYEIGSGSVKYEYKELLYNYEMYSTTYQRSSITYHIEALGGTIASENYDNINAQYIDIVVKVAELKETKKSLIAYRDVLTQSQETTLTVIENIDTATTATDIDTDYSDLIEEINDQIETIDTQIAQYNKNISSTEASMTDAKLQEEIANFYDIFQNDITLEEQNKLKNDFLKKCYGLILYKEQQDYDQAYQKYLEIVKEIETIKYRLGVTSQSTLDTADTNLLKNGTIILKNNALFDTAFSFIKDEVKLTDELTIVFPLLFDEKIYEPNKTVDQFTANNMGVLQLQNSIKSYQNYMPSAGSKSYSLYKQVELKIKDYQLQVDERKNSIKTYVKEAIFSYENAFKSMNAAESEVKLKKKMCDIVTAKKEHKKATEIELRQAICEKESAEIAYYQCCYEIVVWQNILDNNIYGATP